MSITKKATKYSLAALATLGIAGGMAPSYAVDTASQDSVAHMQTSAVEVSKLHAEIAKQASAGDATAVADLEKLEALSPEQIDQLEGYLSGAQEVPAKSSGNVAINSSQETSTSSLAFQSVANDTKEIWGMESFTFVRIKNSETKATGNYTVNGGTVTGTVGQTCTVERSYNPMQTVASSPSSAHIANGKAVFECHVTSSYGLPVVGGNFSERDGTQFIEGDPSGAVFGNGWR